MAFFGRATAQNIAAATVGVMVAVLVATAQNYAALASRQAVVDDYAEAVATVLRQEARLLIDAFEAVDVSAPSIDPAVVDALFDPRETSGARTSVLNAETSALFTPLGLAVWSALDPAATPETLAAPGGQSDRFENVVATYRDALDAAFETAPLPIDAYTVSELALKANAVAPSWNDVAAIPDPAPFDRGSIWLMRANEAGDRRIALRVALNDLGLLDTRAKEIGGLTVGFRFDASEPHFVGSALSLSPSAVNAAERIIDGPRSLEVVVSAQASGFFELKPSQIVPALLLGLLVGLAQFALLRAERRRSDEKAKQHKTVMRNIALKQRELEASEARFKRLAESTNVVPWTANLDTQRFTYVGPQIEDLTGYPARTWYARGFWTHHIHPEDRKSVLMDQVATMPFNAYHTIEYRVRSADGRILFIRNMLSIARKQSQDGGKPVSIAQGFLLDVTDMKRAEASIEEGRKKAEDANRVKSEFLANMSHELRTPLNAVIGFSEIMKDEVFGPIDPQYREYAESIHTSGRHLLDLINDVLDLSKIEAGRIDLAEEETDVGDLLTNCLHLLHERISSAGLHSKLNLDPDLPTMLADERRLKQVLLNLISNAVKFTPPGGAVIVTGRHMRGGVAMSVRDTGVGMSQEEIPRALAKFGQIDGELARKHDGTGLGLPIAKSLIELHGGELTIASEKGKGTEVCVWLPAARILRGAA